MCLYMSSKLGSDGRATQRGGDRTTHRSNDRNAQRGGDRLMRVGVRSTVHNEEPVEPPQLPDFSKRPGQLSSSMSKCHMLIIKRCLYGVQSGPEIYSM